MRDLVSHLAITAVHFAAILTASPTAVTVDRRGYDSVTLITLTGIGGITFTGTNKLTWVAEESDDGTNWTAMATGVLLDGAGAKVTIATGGIVESYVAAKAAASTNHYGYIGDKRYARMTPTFGGTHSTGTTVGLIAVLGHPQNLPAA